MSDASSWNAPQAPVANYKPSPRYEAKTVVAPEKSDPKAAKPILAIETKKYPNGTIATGVAPLPTVAPEEQKAKEASLQPAEPAVAAETAKTVDVAKPSAADLDAVAPEEKAKAETATGK